MLYVRFKTFHMENSAQCQADFVQLYDGETCTGTPVARLCGYAHPYQVQLAFPSGKMCGFFHSDALVEAPGFSMELSASPRKSKSYYDVQLVYNIVLVDVPYSYGEMNENEACQCQLTFGGSKWRSGNTSAWLSPGRGFESCCSQKRKNAHWADPCTEGAPIVRQDLSGRPAM